MSDYRLRFRSIKKPSIVYEYMRNNYKWNGGTVPYLFGYETYDDGWTQHEHEWSVPVDLVDDLLASMIREFATCEMTEEAIEVFDSCFGVVVSRQAFEIHDNSIDFILKRLAFDKTAESHYNVKFWYNWTEQKTSTDRKKDDSRKWERIDYWSNCGPDDESDVHRVFRFLIKHNFGDSISRLEQLWMKVRVLRYYHDLPNDAKIIGWYSERSLSKDCDWLGWSDDRWTDFFNTVSRAKTFQAYIESHRAFIRQRDRIRNEIAREKEATEAKPDEAVSE